MVNNEFDDKKVKIISKFDSPFKGFKLIKESYKSSRVTGGEWVDNLIFTNTRFELIEKAIKLFKQWDYEDQDSFFSYLLRDFIENMASELVGFDKIFIKSFKNLYRFYNNYGLEKLIDLFEDINKILEIKIKNQ